MKAIFLKSENKFHKTVRPLAFVTVCVLLLNASVLLAAEASGRSAGEQGTALWLTKAERALAEDRLTKPPTDNAVSYIERVLKLEPGNLQARELLGRVVARYTELAERAWRQGETTLSRAQGRAGVYRDRAAALVAKYDLMPTQLERLDKILLLERETAPSRLGLERVAMDKQLGELLGCHIELAETALDRGELSKAKRHQQAAETLVARHGLSNPRLERLSRQVRDIEIGGRPTRLFQLFGTF